MMAALALVAPLIGATEKKTTSGSPVFYIIIIIGVGFYFLIYRPQQKKAKALREQGNKFDVGDEVLTAGGIVGHIIDIDGDRVTLETSVGASFVVLKQYVLRRLDAPEPTEHDEYDEHDEEGEHDDHEYDDSAEAEDDETSDGNETDESDEPDASSDDHGTAPGDDDGSGGHTGPLLS
jgi:preprotein translocase subunit YajC